MVSLKRAFFSAPSILVLVSLLTLWLGSRDQDREFVSRQLIKAALRQITPAIISERPIYFVQDVENEKGKKLWEETFFSQVATKLPELKRWETGALNSVEQSTPDEKFLSARFVSRGHFIHIHVIGSGAKGSGLWLNKEFRYFYPTWLSLLPVLFCVWLMGWRKKVLSSFLAAILLGALIYEEFDVFAGVSFVARTILGEYLFDWNHVLMVLFLWNMMWLAQLFLVNGAVDGVIRWLQKFSPSRFGAQLTVFLSGFILFFDDSMSCTLRGTIARGWFDKIKMSRAKLAYIVNSTAIPFASLALFSTWHGDVRLFEGIVSDIGTDLSVTGLLLESIPLRFYSWMTLLFVLCTLILQRDFKVFANPKMGRPLDHEVSTAVLAPGAHRILVPLAIFLMVAALGLSFGGWMLSQQKMISDWKLWGQGLSFYSFFSSMRNAPVSLVLGGSSVLAVSLAAIISLIGGFKGKHFKAVTRKTVRVGIHPIGILLCAWAINVICTELRVADFILSIVPHDLGRRLLPLTTFLAASLVSFMTGTGWGALAMMLPTLLPMGYQLGGKELLILSAASLIDGAVVGEHVSPLANSTIFSSVASGCSHWVHVRTQMLYAFFAFFSAAFLGYFLVSYEMPMIVSYFLGACFMIFILTIFGVPTNRVAPGKTKEDHGMLEAGAIG